MRRVTGIGGIFFKSRDPKALTEWYRVHLGLQPEDWGGVAFRWTDDNPSGKGTTIWNPFPADTKCFEPSASSFVINYRVADLRALNAALKAEGCKVEGEIQESEFGKFGWVIDPEGNKIELWEPPAGQ
jgi:predicted enzyme related to lactoylglutathione lyase